MACKVRCIISIWSGATRHGWSIRARNINGRCLAICIPPGGRDYASRRGAIRAARKVVQEMGWKCVH